MAELWTPQNNEADVEREALVTRTLGEHIAGGRALERELRRLDPYLRVVFIGERAPTGVPGVHPGRWHIQRKNPDAPDTYLSLLGPGGSYREPDSSLIEEMKRQDLWKEGAMERLMKTRAEEIERRRRDEELRREQNIDEAAATYRAAKRVAGEGGMKSRRWAKGLVGG